MSQVVAGVVDFTADGSTTEIVLRVEEMLRVKLEPERVVTGKAEYFATDALGLRIFLTVRTDTPGRCTLSYASADGDPHGEVVDIDFHFRDLLRRGVQEGIGRGEFHCLTHRIDLFDIFAGKLQYKDPAVAFAHQDALLAQPLQCLTEWTP